MLNICIKGMYHLPLKLRISNSPKFRNMDGRETLRVDQAHVTACLNLRIVVMMTRSPAGDPETTDSQAIHQNVHRRVSEPDTCS